MTTQIHPIKKTAIVAEGGGQRGVFSAGVFDAFQHANFNPFMLGLGASAGAQNLFSYFVGVPGYARRAIAELSVKPNFFVPYRWFGRCGVLDLDSYFAHIVNDENFRLPYQQTQSITQSRQLYFVATKKDSLKATYLDPEPHNMMRYLKASSAVPLLYKGGVQVQGDTLIDGAVSDPIPVRRAYLHGATDIVVVRTVPISQQQSCWRQRLSTLKLDKALPAQYKHMLDVHEQAYVDALEFMRSPPPGVRVMVLAPKTPLRSMLLGSNSYALRSDYLTGRRLGANALPRLNNWLEKTAAHIG